MKTSTLVKALSLSLLLLCSFGKLNAQSHSKSKQALLAVAKPMEANKVLHNKRAVASLKALKKKKAQKRNNNTSTSPRVRINPLNKKRQLVAKNGIKNLQ